MAIKRGKGVKTEQGGRARRPKANIEAQSEASDHESRDLRRGHGGGPVHVTANQGASPRVEQRRSVVINLLSDDAPPPVRLCRGSTGSFAACSLCEASSSPFGVRI